MQSLADYFELHSVQTIPEYLAFGSLIIFIVGIVSLVFPPIQIRKKSSPYFGAAFILLLVAILAGWKGILDVVIEFISIHI